MKMVKFLFVLFLCISGTAFASMPFVDVAQKVAFDGKETVVAITSGWEHRSPEYALHYSKDFGKSWQHVEVSGTNPSDEKCVKWYQDKNGKTHDSFSTIRYLGNEKLGYKFFAVGADARVCSSSTGTDGWKLTPWHGDPEHNVRDIAVGDVCESGICKSVWVVVGRDGAIYSSEDPEKDGWHSQFSDRTKDFEHIAYGNNPNYGPVFVANTGGFYSQELWFSHNGVSWEQVKLEKFHPATAGGFVSLYYEPAKNKFVVLNTSLVKEGAQEMTPLVFSSSNGKTWQMGTGSSANGRFNDFVYAEDQDTFVAVGMQQDGEALKGDTEKSTDLVNWTSSNPSSFVLDSIIYSKKTQQLVATWLQDTLDTGGIATRTLDSNWVLAELHSVAGDCASQHENIGLFSKPIVIKDPAGQEHFIVTPANPGGCAYWATDPKNWYASNYHWN